MHFLQQDLSKKYLSVVIKYSNVWACGAVFIKIIAALFLCYENYISMESSENVTSGVMKKIEKVELKFLDSD